MIRSEHSIVSYDFINRQVTPDRLLRGRDAIYLQAAEQCLAIYRQGAGRIRQELHSDVEDCLGAIAGCPPRRIAGFCKLLDDAGDYAVSTGKAASLRKRLFSLAATLHPIVENREGIFENELLAAQTQSPHGFDSELERRIADLWETKPVEGWQFARDQEFLVQGQQVFTPDFILSNNIGDKIYIEVVGFWTPE
jgi:predicted nuclease of restriction endonuclease-like RecB superfamily